MPSNYEEICRDNIRRRGEEFDDIGRLISEQLYSDRTHFIYELLQNAEDALDRRKKNNPESKLPTNVKFLLYKNHLEFRHFGEKFNTNDVKGISDVLKGTKSEDKTQIGKFGIGFKSVYAFTSTPKIHSVDEHFVIERYIRPRSVDKFPKMTEGETVFIFPFNHENLSAEHAFHLIEEKLKKIGSRILLFLKNISEIEWKIEGQDEGQYLKESNRHSRLAQKITVIGQHGNEDEEEEWLVFMRHLDDANSSCESFVEVAFRLKDDGKSKKQIIQKTDSSPLVVYFPTKLETRFGFLVQGSYDTTASRSDIEDNEWNKKLIEETSFLVTEQVLPTLKEMGLFTVSLLEALPIRMNDFPEDGMFYPIVEVVRDALMDQELLPADDGTFVSARNAKLASAEWLRTLLRDEQLMQLFKTENPLKWISGEITERAKHDLWKYIREDLKVEEITPDSFARKIESSFFEKQTDDWMIAFYKYLSGQEALWRSPRWVGDTGGLLRGKPILRLQDNKQEVPFRPDGMANAYLPPPEETDFPVVKRQIVENEQAAEFLRRLDLSEPDVFDDIVERVLPKYMRQDVSSITPHEHAMDIKKILRAMASDSKAGKKKVLRAAKNTPFLKAVDQNDNVSFKKPGEIYFPNEKLKTYFSGSHAVWFLDETVGEKAWNELDVESKPRFMKILIDLPWDEKSRLRSSQGHTKDIETIDYELDGLESFLVRFKIENSPVAEHSLILWNFLLEHLKVTYYYSFYEGEYKWFYYHERSARFDARWKRQLLIHAWLPMEGDVRPHRPGDLSPEELPDLFIRDEKLADLLGMKKDEIKRIEEKTGGKFISKEEYEEFKKWKKEKPAFPEKASLNVNRRKDKITEKYHKAPKKRYEKKNYSKKTTENSIDPKTWLRETYTNEKGELICQICQKKMPFKKRNGDYYFESIELLNDIDREMEELHIAMCPLCAAMYNEFVKHDEGAMESLKNALMNSEKPEVSLHLGELDTSVRFVKSHFLDIKTIIEVQG